MSIIRALRTETFYRPEKVNPGHGHVSLGKDVSFIPLTVMTKGHGVIQDFMTLFIVASYGQSVKKTAKRFSQRHSRNWSDATGTLSPITKGDPNQSKFTGHSVQNSL